MVLHQLSCPCSFFLCCNKNQKGACLFKRQKAEKFSWFSSTLFLFLSPFLVLILIGRFDVCFSQGMHPIHHVLESAAQANTNGGVNVRVRNFYLCKNAYKIKKQSDVQNKIQECIKTIRKHSESKVSYSATSMYSSMTTWSTVDADRLAALLELLSIVGAPVL